MLFWLVILSTYQQMVKANVFETRKLCKIHMLTNTSCVLAFRRERSQGDIEDSIYDKHTDIER